MGLRWGGIPGCGDILGSIPILSIMDSPPSCMKPCGGGPPYATMLP